MKFRTRIGVAFGTVAVALPAMATVAFACIPSHGRGRACGVCGGIAGSVRVTGEGAVPFGLGGSASPGMIALTAALGIGGLALFLGGIAVLAGHRRRDTVVVAVRSG